MAEQDFDRVQRWLSNSYWSPGIARERVERGYAHSTLCIAAYAEGVQVGTARVVSDTTRFAYIADVYVDEAQRGLGIGREMVRQLMNHPLVHDASTWCLLTLDAQEVYAALGFEPTRAPERFMICYDKAKAISPGDSL